MMVVVVFVAVVEDVAVGRVVPGSREYGVHESGEMKKKKRTACRDAWARVE
jgi:hypothetical protein